VRSAAIVILSVFLLASPALGQDCAIGVYGNPLGTLVDYFPTPLELESFYVILFTEDTAAAASYSIEIPSSVFVQSRFSGPSGDGLVIDEPTGTNVALAECAIGFGGLPVLVDEYRYIVLPGFCCAFITIGPNTSLDRTLPQYVTCNDITRDCDLGPDLYLGHADPIYETSFSAVKSLFHR
jgi:hypothetical protein